MCSTDDEESVFSVERRRRKMTSCHFIHFNLPPGEIRPTGGCHSALISCQLHSLPTNPLLPFSLSLLAVWRGIFCANTRTGATQPTKVAVCVRTKRGEGISSGVGRRRSQSYMSEGGGICRSKWMCAFGAKSKKNIWRMLHPLRFRHPDLKTKRWHKKKTVVFSMNAEPRLIRTRDWCGGSMCSLVPKSRKWIEE